MTDTSLQLFCHFKSFFFFFPCWLDLGPESKSPGCFLFSSVSKKVSATPGNLLEMQIFRSQPSSTSQKLWGWDSVIYVLNCDTGESLKMVLYNLTQFL